MAQAVKNPLASAGDVGSGENWQPGLQLVRYYQELILWAQFLYLLISRKVLNPSWWRLFIVTSRKLHETNRNLLEKYVLVCIYSPFTIITHILTFLLPCLFGAVSQSYLRCCLLGCSPHFAPNKTKLATLMLCFFFFLFLSQDFFTCWLLIFKMLTILDSWIPFLQYTVSNNT